MDGETQEKDWLLEGVTIGREGPALVSPLCSGVGSQLGQPLEAVSQQHASQQGDLKGQLCGPYRHPTMETFIHPSNVIKLMINIKTA